MTSCPTNGERIEYHPPTPCTLKLQKSLSLSDAMSLDDATLCCILHCTAHTKQHLPSNKVCHPQMKSALSLQSSIVVVIRLQLISSTRYFNMYTILLCVFVTVSVQAIQLTFLLPFLPALFSWCPLNSPLNEFPWTGATMTGIGWGRTACVYSIYLLVVFASFPRRKKPEAKHLQISD